MKVKIHGGRGSWPVSANPTRIEEILESVFDFAKRKRVQTWPELRKLLANEPRSTWNIYGGHTTCLELISEAAGQPIFLDLGTGFTAASADATSALNNSDFRECRGRASIFLTHTHWDHIMGLMTAPQIYHAGNLFDVYGVHKGIEKRIRGLFEDEYFPVSFDLIATNFRFHQVKLNSAMKIGSLDVSHFAQSHPGGSFAYRFEDGQKTFVFATDTSLRNATDGTLEPGNNFYSNADLIILDAHYTPEDYRSREEYGHAHVFAAVDFAVREKAKRVVLFHQDPSLADEEVDRQLDRARTHLRERHAGSTLQIDMVVEGTVYEI